MPSSTVKTLSFRQEKITSGNFSLWASMRDGTKLYACTASRCSAASGYGRDEGLTSSLSPLVRGIEAKAFWQGPYRWTSYPAPHGFPDSASLKGDKDCNLKYFIDTLKFTAVLCLGERYWPVCPDANRILPLCLLSLSCSCHPSRLYTNLFTILFLWKYNSPWDEVEWEILVTFGEL